MAVLIVFFNRVCPNNLNISLIIPIVILPVYHIEEFEYIPGQNPDPEPGGKSDLF
jgi:hypothetical protein